MLMKKGKNHVSWNENPPQTAAQVVENQARATGKDDSDSERIGSPPRINKTTAVTSSAEYEEMRKKLERLKEEERQVDSFLSSLKEQAEVFNGRRPPSREQTAFLPAGVRNIPEQMYVRFKDITSMPDYRSETVIGIGAPSGTSLEVPDPDQGRTPGDRRFQMYLSSKGTPESKGKGDPINVYLVQPRAEPQDRSGRDRQSGLGSGRSRPGSQGGYVTETPQSQRAQHGGDNPKPSTGSRGEPSAREPLPNYVTPSQRPGEPRYGYAMPHPYRAESGYGPGRPPYYPQEHREGGHHHSGSYQDQSWGPPSHPSYGHPPPGYHPPAHRQARPGSQHSPQSQKHRPKRDDGRQGSDRARDDGMYPYEAPPSNEPGGSVRGDLNASPFRPRARDFHPPHEVGRTASSGGEAPPPQGTPGVFRPPPSSPSSQQQNLLNMPLQSPDEQLYAPGFSPPGGPREQVRSGNVEFPIPSLQRERGDYRDRWRPPHPKMGPSSREEDPRSHSTPRSRR